MLFRSPLADQLALACRLPVAGLHVDAVRAGDELPAVLEALPPQRELSVGIVDGRNIWRTDLDQALARLRPALERRRGRLWIAPSCSLLHVPLGLAEDAALDGELRGWLAGATEKMGELDLLKRALRGGEATLQDELRAARALRASRTASARVRDPAVAQRLERLAADLIIKGTNGAISSTS